MIIMNSILRNRMKILFLLGSLCSLVLTSSAQHFANLNELKPADFDNIHVQKLEEDSLNSSFAIWVKKEVAAHYHENHTETITVLEGTATMTLGNEEFQIATGSVVFIPKGTIHSVQVSSKSPLLVISVQSPFFDGSDRIFVK